MSERKPARPRHKRGQERKALLETKATLVEEPAPVATSQAAGSGKSNKHPGATATRSAPTHGAKPQQGPDRRRDARVIQRLKVVVRQLPPTLPKEVFLTTLERYTQLKKTDYLCYLPGKPSKQKLQPGRASRAYLKFRRAEDMTAFMKAFKGHAFVNGEGQEFVAQVELAPYAKIPKNAGTGAKDPLQGTLEQDADFLAFLNPPEAPVVEEPVASVEPVDPYNTPLIEFLRAQKTRNAAKNKAHKAKQQEEKRRLAQEKADASSEKIKAQQATETKKKAPMAVSNKVAEAAVADVVPSQTGKRAKRRAQKVEADVIKSSNGPKEILKPPPKGHQAALQPDKVSTKSAVAPAPSGTAPSKARKAKEQPAKEAAVASRAPPIAKRDKQEGSLKEGPRSETLAKPGRSAKAKPKQNGPASAAKEQPSGAHPAPRKQRSSKKAAEGTKTSRGVDQTGPTPAEMAAGHAKPET